MNRTLKNALVLSLALLLLFSFGACGGSGGSGGGASSGGEAADSGGEGG